MIRKFRSQTVIIFAVFLFIINFQITAINNLHSIAPSTAEDELYAAFAEVMPVPIGGMESIYKKITYPEIARRIGIEGKVYLLIYIDESGSVNDVKVIKTLGGGCDEAAVKAIKDTKFTSAKNKDVPLKVKLALSITFKIK